MPRRPVDLPVQNQAQFHEIGAHTQDVEPHCGEVGRHDPAILTPIGDDEGELIAAALGKKRAILLAHHGQLCAGASVQEAAVLAYHFEVAARIQLLAMAAGEIKPLDPACAKDAHDYRLKPAVLDATFLYQARLVLANGGIDCLER